MPRSAASTTNSASTTANARYYEQAQRRDQRRSSYNDPRYPNSSYNDPYNDPRYRTDYDATRYYRDDPRYQERMLTSNDQVYRGSDGRYYCKRNDGTTGLIIGGAGRRHPGQRHRRRPQPRRRHADRRRAGRAARQVGRSEEQRVRCR